MATTKKAVPQSFLVRDPVTQTFKLVSPPGLLKAGAKKAAPPKAVPATYESLPAPRHVVILGAGISGLAAAYYLLRHDNVNFRVTILEANNRAGGRSLTLRDGDRFTEVHEKPDGSKDEWTQTCSLRTAPGAPYPAYLNAGPGRIPSAHFHVLSLCKELGVELEVYVMQSRSNLIQGEGVLSPMINRRVANDTRGYIAQDLYNFLKEQADTNPRYLDLLKTFGTLTEKNGITGYNGSQRSGYEYLPGTNPGKVIDPIHKNDLLSSAFWKHRFYQPEDFLWQATSFQPVGGMDMIEKALTKKIIEMGGRMMLNTPVTRVKRTRNDRWQVSYGGIGPGTMEADICLCNIPIPLMKDKVSKGDFEDDFWNSFSKVMNNKEFLEATCKVGWQANRDLWQKIPDQHYNHHHQNPVIPIFGGISYTTHPMTQMWYPSDRFHDELGVLTGAYNYEANAEEWGKLPPEKRLAIAREGAKQLHGAVFANGLKSGITIAWHNIPTQKGGWADWSKVDKDPQRQAEMMNTIRNGDHNFFVIGDQVSWLPGWKEGAVCVAEELFGVLAMAKDFSILNIEQVPNTRELVQGFAY
jgi:monoamine oxidase